MQLLHGMRLQVTLHVHSCQETGVVSRLVSLLDGKTGQPARQRPRCLLKVRPGRCICSVPCIIVQADRLGGPACVQVLLATGERRVVKICNTGPGGSCGGDADTTAAPGTLLRLQVRQALLVCVSRREYVCSAIGRPYACHPEQCRSVILQMHRWTCLSTFDLKCGRALGRLALRDGGRTIAVGVVTELLQLS